MENIDDFKSLEDEEQFWHIFEFGIYRHFLKSNKQQRRTTTNHSESEIRIFENEFLQVSFKKSSCYIKLMDKAHKEAFEFFKS